MAADPRYRRVLWHARPIACPRRVRTAWFQGRQRCRGTARNQRRWCRGTSPGTTSRPVWLAGDAAERSHQEPVVLQVRLRLGVSAGEAGGAEEGLKVDAAWRARFGAGDV